MMPGGTHPYRGRFAPSPTGDLHFGSLVAAVGSWVRARVAGGTWIVRIEDLDPRREVPGAAVRIIETLGDFGMASDEPIEYQSQRIPFYRAALERLLAAGAAFECRCSRGDLGADAIHRACVVPSDAARTPAYRLRAPAGSICFHAFGKSCCQTLCFHCVCHRQTQAVSRYRIESSCPQHHF